MLLDNSNDKNAELLLRISEPFVRIVEDEGMQKGIEEFRQLAKKSQLMQFVGIMKLAPVFLKDHRDDVYEIVAALSNQTVEEVAKQSTRETYKVLQELLKDEDLVRFFTSTDEQETSKEKK